MVPDVWVELRHHYCRYYFSILTVWLEVSLAVEVVAAVAAVVVVFVAAVVGR